MTPAIDINLLPAPARKALSPNAPTPLKTMAARGLLPGVSPTDIVTVVALLSESTDGQVAAVAQKTLGSLPASMLQGALSGELPAGVIDLLADCYASSDEVLGKLLDAKNVLASTVQKLASAGSEMLCEKIAVNESLLLANPSIIEALYMNRRTRMSTADRVLELAVRHGLKLNIPAFEQAAAAVQNQLIAEPSPERTPDDEAYLKTDALAQTIFVDIEKEDTHEVDPEGTEHVREKCKPLWVAIGQMTISQKVRRAILGTAAERGLLVRDTNRIVSGAVIHSPLIQEPEIVRISASRQVDPDILRVIANNRDWTRNYQVKINLVMNPRTPLTFAAKIMPLLRESELKKIAKSKDVTSAIATAARHQLQRRGIS